MVLYSALLFVALLATAPWWLWQMVTGQRYRAGLAGRLGRLPASLDEVAAHRGASAGLLWLHAVSVGEVLAAERLVRELRSALPAWQIVVSTTTATGHRIAQDRLRVPIFYFPLDFAFAVKRYLRALKPTLFMTMESELWPRMIVECARAGIPVAVVNARVSDRSLPRYLRLRRLWKPLLGSISLFCAQSEDNARRLLAIGAPAAAVRVTGNLKYDAPAGVGNAMVRRVGSLLGPTPLVVAGSTLAGEEAFLLEHWPRVLNRVPDAILLIAPRHPQRFDEVFSLVSSSGYSVLRCSDLDEPVLLKPSTILLLDTLGDLAAMYGLARAAFVGGSLIPSGGHNPLEAARFGIPVLMGASYENFREMVEPMIADGSVTVVDPASLADALVAALQRPHHVRATIAEGRGGTTTATIEAVLGLIGRSTEVPR